MVSWFLRNRFNYKKCVVPADMVSESYGFSKTR